MRSYYLNVKPGDKIYDSKLIRIGEVLSVSLWTPTCWREPGGGKVSIAWNNGRTTAIQLFRLSVDRYEFFDEQQGST